MEQLCQLLWELWSFWRNHIIVWFSQSQAPTYMSLLFYFRNHLLGWNKHWGNRQKETTITRVSCYKRSFVIRERTFQHIQQFWMALTQKIIFRFYKKSKTIRSISWFQRYLPLCIYKTLKPNTTLICSKTENFNLSKNAIKNITKSNWIDLKELSLSKQKFIKVNAA